jgi:GNAT superfamily N-acetyltransferase
MSLEVRAARGEELHDLRRRVLRNNEPDASVSDERDDEASTIHRAVYVDDVLVACGTVYPSQSPLHPEVSTYELRFVATDFAAQGHGYGHLLMEALEQECRERGVEELWANGRDSALGFYDREGWRRIPGSEHASPYTGLPHTVIWKPLA